MPAPTRAALLSLSLLTAASLAACNKGEDSSNAPAAAKSAPSDPVEAAIDDMLERLAAGDYAKMKEITASPLTEDLTESAYTDLSSVVEWLGYVDVKTPTQEDIPVEGGTRRTYKITFEKEEVVLEATVLNDGKIMGFTFSGDGFYRAEHGVIADQYREFKVYDFHWTTEAGEKVGVEIPQPDGHVAYHLIVGGIEAFAGKHHIRVEKMVVDGSGKEIFREPIEYDVTFEANAEGIPRGEMTGEFDVPAKGDYELVLKLRDDVAVVETEYRVPFKVDAVAKK